MNDLYDGLLEELECKICMTYMSPPIRQCETGHSICQPCRKKLPKCPLCQSQFTESRNISLEALASKMHFPCVNNKAGCMERVSLHERDAHERSCSHKRYKCAYSKCTWMGRYEEILDHWAEKKTTSRPYRNINVCHIKIQKTEAYYVNIIQAYDCLFWYKFKSSGGKMCWAIQLIGQSDKANDYYFEIEMFKPGQPIRRGLLRGDCQPEEIENHSLFKPGSCVMTTMDSVGQFFGEDQLLIYYMRVRETADYENSGNQDNSKREHAQGSKSQDDSSGRKHNFKGYQNIPKKNFKKKPM